MSMVYSIQVMLPGNPIQMELCRCLTPDAVGALLSSLLRQDSLPALTVVSLPGPPDLVTMSGDGVVVNPHDLRAVLRLLDTAHAAGLTVGSLDLAAMARLTDALPPF